ncbi:hypothetical protein QAD02_001106 [Eretmocerus hayati]|uniref:Uncharacterized protein n=1 Tax=Eretmocerus hayati TaxID=131215 RepID=A0ACC2NFG8_9HYME|nr:hypothetical protein QAD02_001106 [Eretmocerus hayati]
MRGKWIIFIFIILLLWASVTYFAIFQQSTPPKIDESKYAVDELQRDLRQLLSSNEKLLETLGVELVNNRYHFRNPKIVLNNLNKNEVHSSENKKLIVKDGKIQEVGNQHNDLGLVTEAVPAWESALSLQRTKQNHEVIPVLVISCNRVTVRRCLDQLIKYRPSKEQFPIIVSQDCGHPGTANVIRSYGDAVIPIQQPDQSEIEVPPREKKYKGYFKIARHYKWALDEIFFKFKFNSVIIVEDDLDVSPDFYEYFSGTLPILNADPSLWCVSAWNDNGKPELIDLKNPQLLYRSDFFPGLGWMLTRKLWLELSPKWPKSYWDDWLRRPEQRKNRSCIRPEVSRTRTFGKIGVSNGMFYEKHLQFMKLNEQSVPFSRLNLTYLSKNQYDPVFTEEVYTAKIVTQSELKSNKINSPGPIRIPYYSRESFKAIAKLVGIMDDFKSGVPRTGYQGVVSFFYRGRRTYLAPATKWSGYDPK